MVFYHFNNKKTGVQETRVKKTNTFNKCEIHFVYVFYPSYLLDLGKGLDFVDPVGLGRVWV